MAEYDPVAETHARYPDSESVMATGDNYLIACWFRAEADRLARALRLREEAAAAIQALQQQGQWQDISTAPKDGSWVLVYQPWDDDPSCGVCQWSDGKWQLLADENRDPRSDQSFGQPTHWQPLPPPPTT